MRSVDGPDRAFSRILLVSYGARAHERSPLRLDLLFGRDNTLRSFSRPWPSTWPCDTAFSSLARIMRGLASGTKQQGNATCEDAKKIINPIQFLHGPSVPHAGIARCNKGGNPPDHLGLSQQGRVTLIRHDDDFKLAAPFQHLIQGQPGQHI